MGMNKYGVLCFSINNWEKRKARKQHFMSALARRPDIKAVMYAEPPVNFIRLLFSFFCLSLSAEDIERRRRALSGRSQKIKEKLFVFTPVFFLPLAFRFQPVYNANLRISVSAARREARRLGLDSIILWIYQPLDNYILKLFKERVISVYDWAENWSKYFIEFRGGKKEQVAQLEEKTARECDIVFTVSNKLLSKAATVNKNSYLLRDGVDAKVFDKSGSDMPSDLKNIKKPILGYLGTINERVDVDLLLYISDRFPQVSIVMIGDIHERRHDVSLLKDRGNIYLLGSKEYGDLGQYTVHFDACILPYVKEKIPDTRPTKVFDYLATGKPIITTAIKDINDVGKFMNAAGSKEEFAAVLEEILKGKKQGNPSERKEFAKQNSWDHRASEIMDIIRKNGIENAG
jgi:glycosyltransferase involved in cell wall biosynthesis